MGVNLLQNKMFWPKLNKFKSYEVNFRNTFSTCSFSLLFGRRKSQSFLLRSSGKMKNGKYSCNTSFETLEWIAAIIDFLKPFSFLISAHVVNFFKVMRTSSSSYRFIKKFIFRLGFEFLSELVNWFSSG